jgi:hypothetical protein
MTFLVERLGLTCKKRNHITPHQIITIFKNGGLHPNCVKILKHYVSYY